ncbi:hypothetical protein M0R45_001100 [Rubus argutus]|uniref:Uncharacterized protein n=1 Tax=Rubus argutus TaxID=59490 RepID=A0AAW1VLM8_RUBAR
MEYSGNDADLSNTSSYRSVAFAYGNPDESTEQKSNDAEPAFCPAFPVPESLIQNLLTMSKFRCSEQACSSCYQGSVQSWLSFKTEKLEMGQRQLSFFAAELLKPANDLVKHKIHPTSIISGYRLDIGLV